MAAIKIVLMNFLNLKITNPLQYAFLESKQEKMMKKRHKIKLPTEIEIKNPVAKYAGQFNKAQVFKDKTQYQRGAKHKGREPFIMSLDKGIVKGCLFLYLYYCARRIMQQSFFSATA